MPRNLFQDPKMLSAYAFIVAKNRHFYIPAHQRKFSWGNEQIKRLTDDMVEDIRRRMIPTENDPPDFNNNILSFIGTVVCFDDTQHETVCPLSDEMPDNVHTVIDGQQRLTVLMILSIVLHDYIRTRMSSINEGKLKEQCKKTSKLLAKMFEKKTTNPGVYIYYPRMIHAFEDQWATDDKKKYDSPISRYIFHYGEHYRSQNQTSFEIKDRNTSIDKSFSNAVKYVKKEIENICNGVSNKFPDIENIFSQHKHIEKNLVKHLLDNNNLGIARDDSTHWEIVRALLVSGYLMKKVHFVSIVSNDEDYAFSIFDSLNTTGELLTAYETFRPEIIREIGFSNYKNTDSFHYEKAISKYLNSYSQARKKDVTSEMLISFALAETGETLPKKLYRQRNYLKDQYQLTSDKQNYLRHMMHVTDVYKYLWYGTSTIDRIINIEEEPSILNEIYSEIACARVCMDFIKDAKHSVSLALITRFYEAAKLDSINSSKTRVLTLCETIKAIAAFFALWRAYKGTDGIDDCHRKIMVESDGNLCFNRKTNNSPSIADLKKHFRHILTEEGGNTENPFSSREDWINYAKEFPIYIKESRKVAKFILLAASHGTIEDKNHPGLLKTGRPGSGLILSDQTVWHKDDYKTIDHIIPQSKYDGKKRDEIHRIGNLTLLPKEINSLFGNRVWHDSKRELFRMISEKDPEEFERIARRLAPSVTDDTLNNILNKLRNAKYLPMVATISKRKKFDSSSHINTRSENLLGMAWNTLSKWLDFK